MKLCVICGNPIVGKARKYCEKCKRDEHISQMRQYYIINMSRWQQNGLYWDQQRHNKFGTGALGEKRIKNFDAEIKAIQKELMNLGLRTRKENWLYKND